MRTTIDIDSKLLERASVLSGVRGTADLVRLALETLIIRESASRLSRLGGTERGLRPIVRRATGLKTRSS
jgi:hypothetical protein